MNKRLVIFFLLFLIPVYILAVHTLPANINSTCERDNQTAARGATDEVGFCTDIGFNVMRPYFFGMIELPVYRAGINLHWANKLFIPLLIGLALLVWKL